jgi:hypothetical protein
MSYLLVATTLYAIGGALAGLGIILWFGACCCVSNKRKTNPKYKCCDEGSSKAGAVFFSFGAAFIVAASGVYGAYLNGEDDSTYSPDYPTNPSNPSNPTNPGGCGASQYTCPNCNSPTPQQACLYCQAACLCHNACERQCCLENSQYASSLGTNCGYAC